MAQTQREVIDDITAQAARVLRGEEEEDITGLADAFYNAQLEIIDRIRHAFPGESWTLDKMQDMRGADLFQQIQAEINKLNQVLNLQTEQALVNQLIGSRTWSSYLLDQVTPDSVNAQLPQIPLEQVRAIVNTPFQGAQFSQRYGLINDQMAADIRGELTQSMINGETMDQAGARVEDVMGATAEDAYTDRALTIARTEIMRASELGRNSVFDSNADLMADEPEWVVTPDDRLCPWCLRREGMTAQEIEEAPIPTIKNKAGIAKLDPFGNSSTRPLHPRCRCSSVPRLKTWRELGIDMPEKFDDGEMGMRNEDGDWVFAKKETFDAWKDRRSAELGLTNGSPQ